MKRRMPRFDPLRTLFSPTQLIQQILDGKLDFHLFAGKTSILLLGSRDGSPKHQSLNIATILRGLGILVVCVDREAQRAQGFAGPIVSGRKQVR